MCRIVCACPPTPSLPRPVGWVGPRSRALPLPHPGGLLTGGRHGPLCPRSAMAPPPWTAGAPGGPSQEGVRKLCSRAHCGLTSVTASGKHSLRACSRHVSLSRGRTPPPPPRHHLGSWPVWASPCGGAVCSAPTGGCGTGYLRGKQCLDTVKGLNLICSWAGRPGLSQPVDCSIF